MLRPDVVVHEARLKAPVAWDNRPRLGPVRPFVNLYVEPSPDEVGRGTGLASRGRLGQADSCRLPYVSELMAWQATAHGVCLHVEQQQLSGPNTGAGAC